MPNKMAAWAGRKLASDRQERGAADVVRTIQREAKRAGATLKNEGKGGLDPALALKVFRRDKWRCSVDDCKAPQKDLDLDHISGHAKEIQQDPEARKNPDLKKGVSLGHVDKAAALHVICARHHDLAHERERDIEKGKRPPAMGA